MTGHYSERNGVNSLKQSCLNPDVDTVAEVLKDEGWNTYAMTTGPLVEETGLNRGFEEYWYREKDDDLFNGWMQSFRSKVSTLTEPFFLYVHLWELHTPINVPDDFDSSRYGSTPYSRCLSALDERIESLVQSLPSDTTLIIHGDHGESISFRTSKIQGLVKRCRDYCRYNLGLDTRNIEQIVNRVADRFINYPDHAIERGHGENVFDFVSNVPFFIDSDALESDTVDIQCGQVDIFPTILSLAGIHREENVDGESLLPPEDVEERPVYMRACGESLRGRKNWMRSIRHDGCKYVEYPQRDWSSETYDLSNDSREHKACEDHERTSELRRHLPSRELSETDKLDIDDTLRDLGYL
jgi:arylsulfatase A-like enzyme